MKATKNQISFSDADVVNLDDWIPAGESNPYSVRPFLLHDHGFALAVVFASDLRDALDTAVDAGKLDSFKLTQEETEDGERVHGGEGISYLGNHGEPFDIESVESVELQNPPRSFVAQFVAAFGESS